MELCRLLIITFFLSLSRTVPAMIRTVSLGSFSDKNLDEAEILLSPRSLTKQLLVCCRDNCVSLLGISRFLQKEVEFDFCDRQGSSLMWLAFYGRTDLACTLISLGASLKITSDLEYTPLHAAAQQGHLETVKLLYKKGADVNAQAACGSTPLHLAAQNGQLEVVNFLLGCKGIKHLCDTFGRLPLHLAAWKGWASICMTLIKDGCSVHATADDGITALHIASYEGYTNTVCQLLALKADPTLEEDDGAVPADYARKHGYDQLAERLDTLNYLER